MQRQLRIALAFVLAFAPITIAAALDGPSPTLLAAFMSGVFFSMVIVALDERKG